MRGSPQITSMGFALRSTRSAGSPLAAASGGHCTTVRREFASGKDASEADAARHRQQACRRRGVPDATAAKTQVGRAPENQHQLAVGDCGAEEHLNASVRCAHDEEARSPLARSQLARWCRFPEECRLAAARRVGMQHDHFRRSARRAVDEIRRNGAVRRRRGSGHRSDTGDPVRCSS